MSRTYHIRADYTSTADHYELGQADYPASEWTEEQTFLATDPRDAIEQYFKTTIYDPCFENTDGHKLYMSLLVDSEHLPATVEEIEVWKLNTLALFTLDINISVYTYTAEDIGD